MTNLLEAARQIVEARLAGQVWPLYYRLALSQEEQAYKRGKPRPYIDAAVDVLRLIHAEVIVEIGTIAAPAPHPLPEFRPLCCNSGHSTEYWAATGLELHTVDADPATGSAAREACPGGHVHVSTANGVEFLAAFPGRIDFLYLDAWDLVPGMPFAEKHLEAWRAARDKMRPTSLVLIDDTDVAFGGKGRLCVPAMIRDGYEPLVWGRQTMLLRVAEG